MVVDHVSERCFRGVMVSDIHYDDGRCRLDEEGVTLRRYYFPFGWSKRIPYAHIHRVRSQQMGWWTGHGRLWGTARPGYWLPLDITRPRKSTLVVLEVGARVRPSFSPDDPEAVLRLLRERCPAAP